MEKPWKTGAHGRVTLPNTKLRFHPRMGSQRSYPLEKKGRMDTVYKVSTAAANPKLFLEDILKEEKDVHRILREFDLPALVEPIIDPQHIAVTNNKQPQILEETKKAIDETNILRNLLDDGRSQPTKDTDVLDKLHRRNYTPGHTLQSSCINKHLRKMRLQKLPAGHYQLLMYNNETRVAVLLSESVGKISTVLPASIEKPLVKHCYLHKPERGPSTWVPYL